MNLPYTIIDGEIKEHKMSFEMQLNVLNNKDKKRKDVTSIKASEIPKICSCGNVFKKVGSIEICNDCYDKFDSNGHYLAVIKRNKGKK